MAGNGLLLEKSDEGEKVSGVVDMKRLKAPNTSSSPINRETDAYQSRGLCARNNNKLPCLEEDVNNGKPERYTFPRMKKRQPKKRITLT